MEACASWRSSSLQPSLRLRPPGGLWEPGLCLKAHAGPGDVGKRTVGAHTACGRLHSANTPQNTDSVALLACCLSEHSTFSCGPWFSVYSFFPCLVALGCLTPVYRQPEVEYHLWTLTQHEATAAQRASRGSRREDVAREGGPVAAMAP